MTAASGAAAPPAGAPGVAATVGVEEEFLLLRPDGEAAPVAAEVIASLGDGPHAQPELMRFQVESATGVCRDLAELRAQLRERRRLLAGVAAEHGACLVAVGTPPFGLPRIAALTDDPRYRRLLSQIPGVTGEEVTCACHVHVGVASRDLAVAVLNRIRGWLPVLLALGGNSPMWAGRDTGWSSYRYVQQKRWPTFTMPPRCPDAAAYDELVTRLIAVSGAIDPGSVYYFARLSPRYPTLEIRIPDACLDVDDTVLLAALGRALVATGIADEEAGRPVAAIPARRLAEACSAAARRGLDGRLVDPQRGTLVPGRAALEALVECVAPALDGAGDGDAVRGLLAQRMARGSGAATQRVLLRSGADRAGFVAALAARTSGR
ncbi:glutamate--cysteine ligase [Geodermatophilus sp. SYSU D00703]